MNKQSNETLKVYQDQITFMKEVISNLTSIALNTESNLIKNYQLDTVQRKLKEMQSSIEDLSQSNSALESKIVEVDSNLKNVSDEFKRKDLLLNEAILKLEEDVNLKYGTQPELLWSDIRVVPTRLESYLLLGI